MKLPITTEIREELCTGCGLCVAICPSRSLSVINGRATVTGDHSLYCDHCAAICPEGAIAVHGLDGDALKLSTVNNYDEWLRYGDFDTALLVQLMRSRRSCRMFSEEKIDREVLEDLVRIGITAPSGSNCQLWTFTILDDRPAVVELCNAISEFLKRLNRMAERRIFRLFSKLFMKDALGKYYREYYRLVKESLSEWEEKGHDRIFHGAPVVIIVGMKPGASCPREDALLSSQNILLAAHAMGLGTCLIGFAVEAIKQDPAIKASIGIPANESVYSVIALGVPKVKFARQAGRKKAVLRYAERKQGVAGLSVAS